MEDQKEQAFLNKKDNLVLRSLKKAYTRFLKIRGNPRDIALGFALGLFIAMTPTMGFQMAIAVFFAALLKWNKISAIAGVWVTNPLTAWFIYSFSYYIGSRIYGLKKLHTIPEAVDSTVIYKFFLKAPEVFIALIIGGIILGIPLALIGYYFSHSVIKKYQEDIHIKIKLKKTQKRIAKEKMAFERKQNS